MSCDQSAVCLEAVFLIYLTAIFTTCPTTKTNPFCPTSNEFEIGINSVQVTSQVLRLGLELPYFDKAFANFAVRCVWLASVNLPAVLPRKVIRNLVLYER